MRINDKINGEKTNYIVEFPQLRKSKNGKSEDHTMQELVDKVITINGFIDYVSITESPNEHTISNPIQTAKLAEIGSKKLPLPHLTIRDNKISDIDTVVNDLVGIDNVLIIQGDEYIPSDNHFNYSSEMIKAIKDRRSDIDVGAAGNPWYKNKNEEINALKAKADAGADFLITQPIFSVDQYTTYRDLLYSNGIELTIIPGILPIKNQNAVNFVDKRIKQIKIPTNVRDYAGARNSEVYARNHVNNLISQLESEGAKIVDIFSAGDAAFVRSLFDHKSNYGKTG